LLDQFFGAHTGSRVCANAASEAVSMASASPPEPTKEVVEPPTEPS